MSAAPYVLTADEMKLLYGSFYGRGAGRLLDRRNIPEQFWCLVPYAEFWGIGDDKDRENLVREAPVAVRQNLVEIFRAFEYPLMGWLGGPEAKNPNPTEEYAAYSEMFMAGDYAA